MKYTFMGKLSGRICSECLEPLSNVKVRLYRVRDDQSGTILATANPKNTFAVLTEDMVQEKASRLIAETETDEDGRYKFELGDEQDYNGEAFEIDVYCETVPRRKPTKAKYPPVQFTITTLQPQWRDAEDGLAAVWHHTISKRYWCGIRSRFGAWVICGIVTICGTQIPVQGVRVRAFDVDWLEHDELGSAITDAAGKFRIDYVTADFTKTPLPTVDVELIGGPDLYFKIETLSGTVLPPEESPSRGRDPDRENVDRCFCVRLCVDIEEEPPYDNPWFTHVGDFHIISDIDSTTGLTKHAVLGHGGPDYGFFGNLKLRGFCPKAAPGEPTKLMRYRFLYEDPSDPGEKPITGDLVYPVLVGSKLIWWDLGSGPGWTFQSIYVAGSGATPIATQPPYPPGPVPAHVIVPDSNGWIEVDQQALDDGFYGPLIGFRSTKVFPTAGAPGSGAGNPVADPKNGTAIRLIFEAEPIGGGPPSFGNELPKILINNWIEVSQLDLQQFQGPGSNSCSPLSNDLDIMFTADHEQMAQWSVTITSAAFSPQDNLPAPYSNPVRSGSVPRGDHDTEHLNISTWPSCSYTVWLTTRRALTNGEYDDDADSVPVTFCK